MVKNGILSAKVSISRLALALAFGAATALVPFVAFGGAGASAGIYMLHRSYTYTAIHDT